MKMGSVEDFGCFINAVIDEKSFDKLNGYLKQVRKDKEAIIGYLNEKDYGIVPFDSVADNRIRLLCSKLLWYSYFFWLYRENMRFI